MTDTLTFNYQRWLSISYRLQVQTFYGKIYINEAFNKIFSKKVLRKSPSSEALEN